MRVWGSVPIALRWLQHGAQANACMGQRRQLHCVCYSMERKQMHVWRSVPIALHLLRYGAQAHACAG